MKHFSFHIRNKAFLPDREGAVAIEFAILFPFLLLLLYGVYVVSNNIMYSRKVDNVANDIAYVVSRMGRVANSSLDGDGACFPEGCLGGGTELRNIIRNLHQLLMFPIQNESHIVTEVSFVGLPIITDPTLNQTAPRLMWAHKVGPTEVYLPSGSLLTNSKRGFVTGSATVAGDTVTTVTYLECPSTAPDGTTNERYHKATIMYPGQSFIVARTTYRMAGFRSTTGTKFGFGEHFNTNPEFTRTATYAVRSSWIDVNKNNTVDPSEFFNEMHYCTDCFISSSFAGSWSSTNTPSEGCQTDYTALRQQCVSPMNLGARAGGCKFN